MQAIRQSDLCQQPFCFSFCLRTRSSCYAHGHRNVFQRGKFRQKMMILITPLPLFLLNRKVLLPSVTTAVLSILMFLVLVKLITSSLFRSSISDSQVKAAEY